MKQLQSRQWFWTLPFEDPCDPGQQCWLVKWECEWGHQPYVLHVLKDDLHFCCFYRMQYYFTDIYWYALWGRAVSEASTWLSPWQIWLQWPMAHFRDRKINWWSNLLVLMLPSGMETMISSGSCAHVCMWTCMHICVNLWSQKTSSSAIPQAPSIVLFQTGFLTGLEIATEFRLAGH